MYTYTHILYTHTNRHKHSHTKLWKEEVNCSRGVEKTVGTSVVNWPDNMAVLKRLPQLPSAIKTYSDHHQIPLINVIWVTIFITAH